MLFHYHELQNESIPFDCLPSSGFLGQVVREVLDAKGIQPPLCVHGHSGCFLKGPAGDSVFNELAGMDLAQLREEVNKLYKEYGDMGNKPPAIVVLDVIPGMRKKAPPADFREGKTKKEKVK